MSHYVRDLIPLKSIFKEVIDNLVIYSEKLEFVSISTVCDYNNGAIVVVIIPNMYPILVQAYFFKGACGS